MKKFKKLLALGLALAMTATPVTAYAASGTIEGEGSFEGYLDTEVFSIELPTVQKVNFVVDPQGLLTAADGTSYTQGAGGVYFANDPVVEPSYTTEGALKAIGLADTVSASAITTQASILLGDHFKTATVDGDTIYYIDKDGDSTYDAASSAAITYSNKSDAIKIKNKSSYDVDVNFKVKVKLPTDGAIKLVTSGAIESATDPSLYIGVAQTISGGAVATPVTTTTAIQVSSYTTPTAVSVEQMTLDKVPAAVISGGSITTGGYAVTVTTNSAVVDRPNGCKSNTQADTYYLYTITGSGVQAYAEASYQLEAKSAKGADWSELTDLNTDELGIEIVWDVAKKGTGASSGESGTVNNGPSTTSATGTYSIANGLAINITYGKNPSNDSVATGVSSVTACASTDGSFVTFGKGFTTTATGIKLNAGAWATATGSTRYLKITLDNGEVLNVTVTVAS